MTTANKLMNLEKELVLTAKYDTDSGNSPRDWDNIGTMLTWQSRYSSPDKNEFSSPTEFFVSIVGESLEKRVFDKNQNDTAYFLEMAKILDKRGYIISPVYCYDHSGTVYSTGEFGCRWDSGLVGVIYATKEKIREDFNVKRITKDILKTVKENFQGECETYTQWANGELYGYVLEDLQGIEVGSCWGFYDNFADDTELLNAVGGHEELGEMKDWVTYDETKIHEQFKLVRI